MAFDITGQLNLRLASGAIRNVASEINNGLRSGGIGAINIPIKADTAALNNLRAQMVQTGTAAEKFAQQSGLAFKRFAAFSLAASPFIAMASGIRTAVAEAFTFDKEMVRLRQVTVEAGSEVGAIAKEVTRLSTTFGVSSQELIKTAVTLKQANLSINDTKDALEALAKSALAPNFDSMAQTTEGAIAVMNQFKVKGKELEQALGSMNAVAGEFAVEAGDLIEVVRRAGGAFQATGGNLNELLGLFTSVRQTTRESAESIATGLRTIFTRIQRNDTVSALKQLGVNLRYTREEAQQAGNMGLQDQFVGAYEAIRRLSAALTQLPAADPRYSAIIEDLGGYRQISKVIPLIQEFAVSERALMVAEAGRVSMTVNAAQAADSYGNRLGKLRETYASLGRSFLDSSSFKAAFDGFESLARGLAMVLEVARPLLPILTTMATIKLFTGMASFTRNFAMGATYHTNTPMLQQKARGGYAFAEGGMVPGIGNKDTVPADLKPGSYVIRKSSVAKYGQEALTRMARGYADGGKVSAMVMPGEYVFTPQQAARIGSSTLHAINEGRMERFAEGGEKKKKKKVESMAPDALEQLKRARDQVNQEEAAKKAVAEPEPTAKPAKRPPISPSVRKIADYIGVDPESVTGTGKGGAVTGDDVRNFHKALMEKQLAAIKSRQKSGELPSLVSEINPGYSNRDVPHAAPGTIPDDIKIANANQTNIEKKSPEKFSKAEYDKFLVETGQALPEDLKLLPGETSKKRKLKKQFANSQKGIATDVDLENFDVATGNAFPSDPSLLPPDPRVRKNSTKKLSKAEYDKFLVETGQALPEDLRLLEGQTSKKRKLKKQFSDSQKRIASDADLESFDIATGNAFPRNAKLLSAGPRVRKADPRKPLTDEEFEQFNIETGQAFDPKARVLPNAPGDTARRRRNRAAADAGANPLPKVGVAAGYVPSSQPTADTVEFNNNPALMQAQIIKGIMSQLNNTTDPDARKKLAQNFKGQVGNLSEMMGVKPQDIIREQPDTFNMQSGLAQSAKKVITQSILNKMKAVDKLIDQINIDREAAEYDPAAEKRRNRNLRRVNKLTSEVTSLTGQPRNALLYTDEYGETRSKFRTRTLKNMAYENMEGPMQASIARITSILDKLNATSGYDKNNPEQMEERNKIKERLQLRMNQFKEDYGVDPIKFLQKKKNDLIFQPDITPEKIQAKAGKTLQEIVSGRTQDRLSALDPTGKGDNVAAARKQAILDEELASVQREYIDGQARIVMKQKGLTSLDEARALLTQQFNEELKGNTLYLQKNASTGNRLVSSEALRKGLSPDPEKGTLAAEIKNRYEADLAKIDPKGKGKNLAESTKQELLAKAELSVREDAVRTIKNQIIEDKRLTDSKAAETLAHEKVTKALDENHQVIVKGNKIMDAQMAAAGNEGKRAGRIQLMNSLGDTAKGLFTKQNLMSAAPIAASYLGDFFSQDAGSAETAIGRGESGISSFKTERTVGGALTGAGAGAIGGASMAFFLSGGPANPFSPLIAGIGATVGALGGMIKAYRDASIEIADAQIGQALKKSNEALTNFANGTALLRPDFLREKQDVVDNEQVTKAQTNSGRFFGLLGYSQDYFQAELNKLRRESSASQVAAKMNALSKLLEDRAKQDVGNNANMNEEARRESFRGALRENGGLGASLLASIAAGTNQDIGMVEKRQLEFMNRARDTEISRRRSENAETEVNRTSALFGSFGSAIEIATTRMLRMSAATKNITDIMDGSPGSFAGSGLSSNLQRPFGAGRDEFMDAVRSITKMAGADKQIVNQADAITIAGTILPEIINTIRSQPAVSLAKGESFNIQVSDALRKSMSDRGVDAPTASSIANLIQAQIGDEDFSKVLRESGQDMGKLVDKLIGPMMEPLKKNFENISRMLDERGKDFAERIGEIARRIQQNGELIDKANNAQIAAVRNRVQTQVRRNLIPENDADTSLFNLSARQFELRQMRLTGFGNGGVFNRPRDIAAAQNPDAINDALKKVIGQIRVAERNVENLSKGDDINASNEAAKGLSNLKLRAADLNQALKNLTDVSERNAAAQDKLSKIQQEREGRQALGMRYATSNIEGRSEIARSFRLLEGAARMGTAAPFSVRDQNQIFSLLSSLSPQMRLQGLGGVSVKELTNQLLNTTFGGAFNLDPQTVALEQALDNFVQQNYEVASRASQIQVDNQKQLTNDLITRLEATQTTFLTELGRIMADNAKLMQETLKQQAATRLATLTKQVGDASMLGKIGIQNNDQFKTIAGLVKNNNPYLEKIMSAGREVATNDALLQRTRQPENVDRFVDGLVRSAGKMKVGEARDQASGVIKSRLEEMGISDADVREDVFKRFTDILVRRDQGGTFKDQQGLVKESLASAIGSVLGERNLKPRVEIQKARRELGETTNIPAEVLDRLVSEAQIQNSKINFTGLKEAISAVEATGKSFQDLDKAIQDAKTALQNIGKADGGPIRFFNKGGWGSGGSTTPHSSDTVNARIAPNEFVVSAGPAAQNKGLLEHINKGGRVGFADGGAVKDAYGNLDIAKGILSNEGKFANAPEVQASVEKARKLAQENAEILFLAQLKDMDPAKRDAFIAKQGELLKNGAKNPQQQGILDALARINKIREEQKNVEKQIKDAEEQRNAPGFPEAMKFIAPFHKGVREEAVAKAVSEAGSRFDIEDQFPDLISSMNSVINSGEPAKAAKEAADQEFKKIVGKSLSEMIANEQALQNHKWLNDEGLFREVLNGNDILIFRSMGGIESIEKQPESVRKSRRRFEAYNDIGAWKRLKQTFNDSAPDSHTNLELIDKVFGGSIPVAVGMFQIDAANKLSKTQPEDIEKDLQQFFKSQRPAVNIKPVDFEAQMKGVIDAQIATLKKQQAEALDAQQAVENTKQFVKARALGFKPPAERLKELVTDIDDPQKLNKQTMLEAFKFQSMEQEANLLSKLSPVKQAKYIQAAKDKLRQGFNGLTAAEQAQVKELHLSQAMNNTDNITAEEINSLLEQKSRMTVMQRAALDLLMEKSTKVFEGKVAQNLDSLNEGEKAVYLANLDSKAREQAYNTINDPAQKPGLMRLGQFLAANEGLISARLSKAEEQGAAAYAKEAALLEMVMGQSGKPMTIPSVTQVFNGKSLGPKVAPPAPAVNRPGMFGAEEAADMAKFASGGLVPGVGNTDSVRANLPVGSYVIKKSSVQSIGANNLAALPHLAKGGVVPAMVMPGEHIFTPDEAAKIGKGNLDHMNQNGRLPGFRVGGGVGGQPGGQAVQAAGRGVMGMGVPNVQVPQGWVLVPANGQKWGGGNPWNQMGAAQINPGLNQPAMPMGANAAAGAMPLPAAANEAQIEQQLQQQMAGNLLMAGGVDIQKMKAEFYELRNKLMDPRNRRNRKKEDIDRYKELLGQLNNPALVQMDAQQQMLGAQEYLNRFQQDPQSFLAEASQMRKAMYDRKASMIERVKAKEAYQQMVYASRQVDPRQLYGAMAERRRNSVQKKPNNNILAKEWEEQKAGVAAHNAKMEEKYGKKLTGPEAVAAHNAKMEEKYGKPINGPEAVKTHNEWVRKAEEARKEALALAEPTEADKAILAQRKQADKVKAKEQEEASIKRQDYLAKKQDQSQNDEIARWRLKEDIEEIRDPGGVKRKAEAERKAKEAQEEKMRIFYEEKAERRREFEEKLNSNYSAADELRKKISVFGDEAVKRASGGIVPGVGSGDTVPALLEPGEMVVPKKHVQKYANGGIVGGLQRFADGGMAQGGPEMMDVAARFNQAATQISQGLSGFSTSISTFNGAVANFGTFVDKFDEAVGKIPGQIELSGANDISVNIMGQDSIVQAVTQALGPMIAQAIRDQQPVEQRAQ